MRSQEPDPAPEEPVNHPANGLASGSAGGLANGLANGLTGAADLGTDRGPHAAPMGSAPPSADRGKVFLFTPRGPSAQGTKTTSRDPVRQLEDAQDRRRMQQNVAAALIVFVLVGAGLWLIDHLRTSARIAACVEAGHRNCVPLDLSQTPGR